MCRNPIPPKEASASNTDYVCLLVPSYFSTINLLLEKLMKPLREFMAICWTLIFNAFMSRPLKPIGICSVTYGE